MAKTTETDHAELNARSWMKSIREMIAKLEAISDDTNDTYEDVADNTDAYEAVKDEISESPLSVQVRSTGWYSPGGEPPDADEFEILLSTGGPALRITGDLDRFNQPENVRLEKQDWFQPWTNVNISEEDQDALDKFAAEFYFGES